MKSTCKAFKNSLSLKDQACFEKFQSTQPYKWCLSNNYSIINALVSFGNISLLEHALKYKSFEHDMHDISRGADTLMTALNSYFHDRDQRYLDIAKLIIGNGYSIEYRFHDLYRTYAGDRKVRLFLCQNVDDINKLLNNSHTATMILLSFKTKDLLSIGLDVNIVNNVGQSLLYIAVKNNLYNKAKILLDHGADTELPKIIGRHMEDVPEYLTPLGLAVSMRSRPLKMIELLLDNGANPNFLSYKTILARATRLNRLSNSPDVIESAARDYECVKLLLEYGAIINKDAPIVTRRLFMLYVRDGCKEMVELMSLYNPHLTKQIARLARECSDEMYNLVYKCWQRQGTSGMFTKPARR